MPVESNKIMCKDCKFWKYREDRWGKFIDEYKKQFGECDNCGKIFGSCVYDPLVMAWSATGREMNGGWVATHPDFGCILGEKP